MIVNLINYISDIYKNFGDKIIISIIILIVGIFLIFIFNFLIKKAFNRVITDRTLNIYLMRSISVTLWIILFVTLLANLGFNVTAFVAGLGIMGFIVGFATRDIFSNLAAGFLILVTKPFKVDDEIEVSGIRGIVEKIDLSYLVLISENNRYIIIPNSKIWGNPITNYSKLIKRQDKKAMKEKSANKREYIQA